MIFDFPPQENDFVINLGIEGDFQFDESKVSFVPYLPGVRECVDIAVIFDETQHDPNGPDMAILRYAPGSRTPGTVHSLGARQDMGCLILASRYQPTQIIKD